MTVRELIDRLSGYDGDMKVVFTRWISECDEEWEDTSYTDAYPVEDIVVNDEVERGAWEVRKVPPFVQIELGEGLTFDSYNFDKV